MTEVRKTEELLKKDCSDEHFYFAVEFEFDCVDRVYSAFEIDTYTYCPLTAVIVL